MKSEILQYELFKKSLMTKNNLNDDVVITLDHLKLKKIISNCLDIQQISILLRSDYKKVINEGLNV
jgi:uncharacterized protein YktB (UPF0637 family)